MSNRWAPPRAALDEDFDPAGELWRDGRIVVLRKGSDFPARCVKCNAPAVRPRRRVTLFWHPPGWYLLLPAIVLYSLVAMAVRRRSVVHLGLCERHQRRVVWGRVVGWGGFAALVAMVFIGAQFHSLVVAVAFLLLLPWAFAALLVNRLVVVVRIDDQATRLKGCGAAFLDSLPGPPAR